MRVRGEGGHAFIPLRFDRAWKLLWEAPTSACRVFLSDSSRVAPQWGGLAWRNAPPPPLTKASRLHGHLHHRQASWTSHKLHLIFLSLQAGSLPLATPHKPAVSIPKTFSITDIDQNLKTTPSACFVISPGRTPTDFSLRAKQPVMWTVEPLHLISAAPIWIREEDRPCTTRKYVTCPPDQLSTLPLVACIHRCTDTRGKGWGIRRFVIRWFLCREFNWF